MTRVNGLLAALVLHERWLLVVQWGLFLGAVGVGSFTLFVSARASERAATLTTEVVEIASTRERLAARSLGLAVRSADPLTAAVAHAADLRPRLVAELGPDGGDDLDALIAGLRGVAVLERGFDVTDLDSIAQTAVPYVQASLTVAASADDLVGELSARGAAAARRSLVVVVVGGAVVVGVAGWAFILLGGSLRRAYVLAARSERAEELERLKSEFIALASHELRTPLTGMIGFTHLLLDKPGLGDDARAWVQHIHSESMRLNEVVEQLLRAGELDAGALHLNVMPLDLEEVVTTAIDLTEGARAGHVGFERNGPPGVRVVADRDHLTTVVSSLLSNALKYGSADGVVHIEWATPGDEVVLSVRDHGTGLSAEQAARLFDRFGRADASGARQVRGLGMGLFVAKRLVEAMGGSISATVDETGTIFTVRLAAPAAAERQAA